VNTRAGNTATHLGADARAAAVAARDLTRAASTSAGAVVLAYHDVVVADDAPSFSYAVSRSRLRQQLDVVARLGLTVVTLPELSYRHRTGQPLDGLVSIVFDDALVGVHHLGLDELAARGWPATLLPVVQRLGADPPWWPGSQRTMTRAELVESVAAGVTLTGHGSTHACLPCLPALPAGAGAAGGAHRVPSRADRADRRCRRRTRLPLRPPRPAGPRRRRAADGPQAYLDECHPHGR